MVVSAPQKVAARFPAALRGEQLADCYATHLLQSLGIATNQAFEHPATKDSLQRDAARDWADSGLMWLSGEPSGPPLRGSDAIPSCARGAVIALTALARLNFPQPLDGAALLCERSKLLGFTRRGRISANGGCRLLAAEDGAIALNLPRDDDWTLLPAWLEIDTVVSRWEQLAAQLAGRKIEPLVARGRLLGLPVAGHRASAVAAASPPPWYRLCVPGRPRTEQLDRSPLVVDLSSLWAGPLCSHLLQAAGARVIKVESEQRLDGARTGSADFFALLNAGKDSVVVDFNSASGRQTLRQLLSMADIVIEGSRPRAMAQLGIDAQSFVEQRPGMIWVSLTGYGRLEPRANWVAFGDDAAVAAGLLVNGPGADDAPLFCGDALCDPLTGMHAAVAAMAFWHRGEGGLLDINLCDVAAHCRGFYTAPSPGVVSRSGEGDQWRLEVAGHHFAVREPRARASAGPAAAPGADTRRVLRECGIQ